MRKKEEEVPEAFLCVQPAEASLGNVRGAKSMCVQPNDHSGRVGRTSNKMPLGREFMEGQRISVLVSEEGRKGRGMEK